MLEQLHGTVWHPIAFASRSLTAAKQNYSQIEKKTLSIVFSCEKFHEYVCGLCFFVQNHHKPLFSIFQRALSKSPLKATTKSDEMNYFVHSVIKSCQISEDRLQQIITETQNRTIYYNQ